jgi:DNA-binding transcriptional ArsR family regulator
MRTKESFQTAKLRFIPGETVDFKIKFAYFAKRRNVCSMPVTEASDRMVAEIFKALGHPARIRILRALVEGEKCVCDLVNVAGLGWSTVSRHLSVMKAAGLVTDEKRGQQVIYFFLPLALIR